MQSYIRQLFLFLVVTASFLQLNAQSWEVYYQDAALNEVFNLYPYAGPDNTVRLAVDPWPNGTLWSEYNFSEYGDFTSASTLSWANEDWWISNVDNAGNAYWATFYKLRKVGPNHQTLWTYNVPTTAGILWTQPLMGGAACLQYYITSVGDVIDLVNQNGQLAHRYVFSGSWPYTYYGGADNSIIYNLDGPTSGLTHWVKMNTNDEVVWEKDLDENTRIVCGSLADGSTLLVDETNNLTKLDAAGNIVWISSVNDFFPEKYVYAGVNTLYRQDGSLILSFTVEELSSFDERLGLVNLNLNDGSAIWAKLSVTPEGGWLTGPLAEMPDGGILACVGPLFSSSNYDKVLLIRTDVNGNTLHNQINGNIFMDMNQDCVQQPGESPFEEMTLLATTNTRQYSGTSDANGHFIIPASSGDFTLTASNPGSYWQFCGFTNPITLSNGPDTQTLHIAMQPLVQCPQLEVSVGSSLFRRCVDNSLMVVEYHNYGTAPAYNAYVTITLDPELEYQSSSIPVASQSSQTFTFNLGTVGINEGGTFQIAFKVDCDAAIGKLLCVESQIFPDTSCIPTAHNMTTNSFCLPVVTSFDPNDKTALVNGKPEITQINPDKELEYLIRFQNTGNDTAFQIVVMDTLSTLLDPASVIPGVSSHPYQFELRSGKVLVFTFSNILLPDSNVNEVASHGFVKFSIRQKTGNPLGSKILNTAAIYFDFNDPVLTNQSQLLVSNPVGTPNVVAGLPVSVWPVPAHSQVWVQWPGENLVHSWELLDMNGRVQSAGGRSSSGLTISRNNLPGGAYWCRCVFDDGRVAVSRVVFD